MSLTIRPYDHASDYQRAYDFLVEIYEPGPTFANWLAPRWEYTHHHPRIGDVPLERAGVVEEGGRILGVVHPEFNLAIAYFQVRPGHDHVKPLLVEWADAHFGGWSRSLGRDVLGVFVGDFDQSLREAVEARGFRPADEPPQASSRYVLDGPVPPAPLPEGFRLHSLADDNDLRQIHRVLWRGFGKEGPAPEEGIAGREALQRAPGFRKDLTIVVRAPDGTYASYSGMWYEPRNRVGYVEPVATDPEYRRLGLSRAAVSESLRRVAALGADVAWVESGQEFYRAMGFETTFQTRLWLKELAPK